MSIPVLRSRPRVRLVSGLAASALALTLAGPTGPAHASYDARPLSASSPLATAATVTTRDKNTDGLDTGDYPVLRAQLRKLRTSGAVAAVAEVTDGALAWRGAVGQRSLSPAAPALPSSQFRAASITKTTIAVLVMQLVATKQLTLNTKLGDLLPRLWPAKRNVTVQNLLSHRGGIADFAPAITAGVKSNKEFLQRISHRYTDLQLIRIAKALPQGKRGKFSYSNTDYVILGLILKKLTGRPISYLEKTRIFARAGMTHSTYKVQKGLPATALKEYANLGTKRPLSLKTFSPTVLGAAGSLVTTAPDLTRFQRALVSGKLVPKPYVAEMATALSASPSKFGTLQYGLGFYRLKDPCASGTYVYGHDGAAFGTESVTLTSPDGVRQVTIAFTGRQYTKQEPAYDAMVAFVERALAITCRP